MLNLLKKCIKIKVKIKNVFKGSSFYMDIMKNK